MLLLKKQTYFLALQVKESINFRYLIPNKENTNQDMIHRWPLYCYSPLQIWKKEDSRQTVLLLGYWF